MISGFHYLSSFFTNAKDVRLDNSQINVTQHFTESSRDSERAMDLLRSHCALNALIDSNERFDAPRCAEETRVAIIQELIDWVNDDSLSKGSSILWLHGGAGVGKSALAQSLGEILQDQQQLAASFFFARTTVGRSDGDTLIPTLAYQLTVSFPDIRPYVEANINKDLSIFTKLRRHQMQQLVTIPLMGALSNAPYRTKPFLIIIDGLDECQDTNVQCDLLKNIADTTRNLPSPFRFLIASRPESHIFDTFDHHRSLQDIPVTRLNLSDDRNASDDIRRFLRRSFDEIKRTHRFAQHLPEEWPLEEDIDLLVERSSSHFVYASTAMKYIQSRKHRPDVRLRVILGLSPPPAKDNPLAQLDELYKLIFSELDDEDVPTVLLLFGLLHQVAIRGSVARYHREVMRDSDIDDVIINSLEVDIGDLHLLLDPLRSILTIDESVEHPSNSTFRVLHASVFDFLGDKIRSQQYYVHSDLVSEALARCIIKNWSTHQEQTPIHGRVRREDPVFFRHLMEICGHARMTDNLRDQLRSLDTLYKYLKVSILDHLNMRDFQVASQFNWVENIKAFSSYFSILRSLDKIDNGNWLDLHLSKVKGAAQTLLQEYKVTVEQLPFRPFVAEKSATHRGETADWLSIRHKAFRYDPDEREPRFKPEIFTMAKNRFPTENSIMIFAEASVCQYQRFLPANHLDVGNSDIVASIADREHDIFTALLQGLLIVERDYNPDLVLQPSRLLKDGLLHHAYYSIERRRKFMSLQGRLSALLITYLPDGTSVVTEFRLQELEEGELWEEHEHLKKVEKRCQLLMSEAQIP